MLWGTFVNACAVVVGSTIGMLLRLREDIRHTIMQGLGLVTVVLGIKMGLDHGNILIPIASIVIGGFIGESLKLEARLASLGKRLVGGGRKVKPSGSFRGLLQRHWCFVFGQCPLLEPWKAG